MMENVKIRSLLTNEIYPYLGCKVIDSDFYIICKNKLGDKVYLGLGTYSIIRDGNKNKT